jgi:branched-subunit amino acid aminotransferase/4-amino-4-deoxychorismate lyase
MPDPGQVEIESLLVSSARTAFRSADGVGPGDGILRIEWSCPVGGDPELLVIPRAIGPEPESWVATVSAAIHPGPEKRRNTKFVEVDAYDVARKEVRDSDIDESLLFDRDGLLVEGGRSNFIVVTASGRLVTPDIALGAVEGLGLSIVIENRPEIAMARLTREDVASARELMSTNIVRGVVPIVELEGRAIAEGQPGVWARRLRSLFRPD